MEIKPIRNEGDYYSALSRISELMDADEGTSEADELDVLVVLVCDYEERDFHIPYPDPIAAIEYSIDTMGLRHRDVAKCFSSFSDMLLVLKKRKPLTLDSIRMLSDMLDMSADILIQRYELAD